MGAGAVGNTVSVGASSSSSSDGSHGHSGSRHDGRLTHQESSPSPQLCTLVPLAESTSAQLAPGGPTPGQWYVMSCNGQDFIPSTGLSWVPFGKQGPKGAAPIDPLVLAEKAADSIALPGPSIHTNPSGYTIVNLNTWLWVDEAAWRPFVASATAGPVTATAVATPSSVSWSMGDGDTVVCQGPGTPYDQNEPASDQQTNCSYTYRQSSAGQPSPDGDPNDGAYQVTASVTWTVTWTATGAPGGGTLPVLQTRSSEPLRVEQVESITTSN